MKNDITHWNGEKYAEINSPQFNINKAFIAEYPFKKNESILDIGCGNGDTTRLLAELSPDGMVIGIDASKTMIESALKNQSPCNINFKYLNAQNINDENKFDTITSFFCMQWIPEKQATFLKIHKALKKGGRFLLIVPMPHATLPLIRQELINKPEWKPYFKDYADPLIHINDCHYELFAKQACFNISTYNVVPTPVYFSTYKQFFRFMLQMTPHISRIPLQKDKEQFVHEILDYYLQDKSMIMSNGDYQLLFHLVKFCGYKF